MSDKPTKFEDLTPSELYRSALEDFALPVDENDKGKKKVLLAAFVEGGVEWAEYVKQHPEVAPEPQTPKYVANDANTVVSSSQPVEPENKWADDARGQTLPDGAAVYPNTAPPVPVAAQPLAATPDQTYLVKMVRDNPLFETRGYRFTKDHPYAVVSGADIDHILTKEDGFRQATPAELREFYG